MPSISVPITFSRTGEMTTDGFKDVSDPVSMDVHYHKRFLIFISKFWETGEDRKAWRAAVHGVAKSQSQLSS